MDPDVEEWITGPEANGPDSLGFFLGFIQAAALLAAEREETQGGIDSSGGLSGDAHGRP